MLGLLTCAATCRLSSGSYSPRRVSVPGLEGQHREGSTSHALAGVCGASWPGQSSVSLGLRRLEHRSLLLSAVRQHIL